METITLNGRALDVQGIKELRPGLSVQEAALRTKKNGIDEVYFNVDGKNFLAYGDALKIADLSKNKISTVTYNGRQGTVVAYENEINSFKEGVLTGALSGIKKTKDAIFGAVSNTVTSVGPTTTAVAIGALGLTGIALYRSGSLAALTADGVAAASSPLGNILGDILKNGSIGALKVITVAGGIAFGITAVVGAMGGVSDVYSAEKDYSTIAAVTRDGNDRGPVIAGSNFAPISDVVQPVVAPAQTNTPVVQPTQLPPVTNPNSEMMIFNRPRPEMINSKFNSVSSFLNNRA